MDPFHVVSLAGDKLDECRRRIQRAITGRRGRAGDRLYRARRTLLTGAGLLTDAQAERLEALFADDRHAAVQAAWGVYQRLIQAYRVEDPGLGKYLMQRLIDSLRQAVPDGLEEIQALARTLTSRSQDILAYFDQPRTSNGPRQAINGRLEHLRGIALGLAQPGQLHHPQPHPHRTPQRPPDNNHLNQPISPTYHTPKHEEPLNQPPQNPGLDTGYNKRLRALAGTIGWLAAALATTTSVYTDDVHLVDSTPIECARSRPTVMRSDLAGWAGYGYCASHSRFFWGLRLHLVCTVHGLAVAWAVTSPGQDEREVLRSMLEHLAPTSARTIIADKGYRSKDLEDDLNQAGLTLLRPAARNEAPRPGAGLLRPLRQRIESVFDTLTDQLGLERHNGRTPTGVTTRVAQRILALTAVIWHNDNTSNPHLRSLTPYDH